MKAMTGAIRSTFKFDHGVYKIGSLFVSSLNDSTAGPKNVKMMANMR